MGESRGQSDERIGTSYAFCPSPVLPVCVSCSVLGECRTPALLGHTKVERSVRYLGIAVEDALEMAEQTGGLDPDRRGGGPPRRVAYRPIPAAGHPATNGSWSR